MSQMHSNASSYLPVGKDRGLAEGIYADTLILLHSAVPKRTKPEKSKLPI